MPKKTSLPEDTALFRQTVGKVQPVKNDKITATTAVKPKPYPKTQQVDFEHKIASEINYEIEQLSLEDSLNFASPGLQKNVLKKLRKGHFGLDAEIDLHGLNSQDAKYQLLHFLHHCVQHGDRCVHIIHGKGYRSPDNMPVLKNNLNLWLRQHQDVLAFCSAPPKEGGTGAVFVLLRLTEKYSEQDDTQY